MKTAAAERWPRHTLLQDPVWRQCGFVQKISMTTGRKILTISKKSGLQTRHKLMHNCRALSNTEGHKQTHSPTQTTCSAVCSGSVVTHLHILMSSAVRFETASRQGKHPQAEGRDVCVHVCVCDNIWLFVEICVPLYLILAQRNIYIKKNKGNG